MELADTQIEVITLCPGFIRTPLTDKNGFKMPFLMEPDIAAKKMRRAIERGLFRYVFPWQWRPISFLMRIAPRFLLSFSSPKSPRRRNKGNSSIF